MDFGRSCYTTDMQFDDAGQVVAKVRWFFAADDAKDFDGPHLFGSTNWSTQSLPTLGIGEVWDSDRKWSNGQRPAGANGTGRVCGPLDWFVNGCPSDAPPLTVTPTGLAQCCVGSPGLLIGGTSVRLSKRIVQLHGGLLLGGSSLTACMPFYQPPFAQLSLDGSTWIDPTSSAPGSYTWDFSPPAGFFVTLISDMPFCPPYTSRGTLKTCHPTLAPGCVTNKLVAWLPLEGRGLHAVPMIFRFRFGPVLWVRFNLVARMPTGGLLIGAERELRVNRWSGLGGLLIGGDATHSMPQARTGGLLIGGQSQTILPHRVGTGGFVIGGTSATSMPTHTTGGLLIGGTSAARKIEHVAGGLKIGGTAAARRRAAATGGLKIGGTSIEKIKDLHATGGLKIGGSGHGKLLEPRTGGIRIGGSITEKFCLTTACCPGVCIASTLNVYLPDGTFVGHALLDVPNRQWNWSDAGSGCGNILHCVSPPGQWRIDSSNQAHCTRTYTVFSLHCAHPFRVDLQTTWAGISCVLDGVTCHYIFSEGAF